MFGFEPWLIVAGILFIQPLIGLLWAYLLYRLAIKMTVGTVSRAVDKRVDNAVENLQEINE